MADTGKSEIRFAASPGVGMNEFRELPEGTNIETLSFNALDGYGSRGILYSRGNEKTVVCLSHPRADVSRHYVIPGLLEVGFAAYVHQCRGLNNDVACEHERLVLDLGGGFSFLVRDREFDKLVLLGNSGGGSLFCFYQQQATLAPPNRLVDTAAGDPCDLNEVALPKADGLIMLATHAGQGQFLLDCIDPSIVDEADPLTVDPDLDMFNPRNGFRPPPESSTYSEEFLTRYRDAQRARVARLDARARSFIAEQARYEAVVSAPTFDQLSHEEQIYNQRRASVGHYMTIYRTEANPVYTDLSLKAWQSTRQVGSVIGPRPDKLNYADGGFSRLMTPRGWLSTWSGLSSRAFVPTTIKDVDVPVYYISYTGDQGCYPVDMKDQLDSCPSSDKQMDFLPASHFGVPHIEKENAKDLVCKWLRERFPVP